VVRFPAGGESPSAYMRCLCHSARLRLLRACFDDGRRVGWGAKTACAGPAQRALANYLYVLKRTHQRGRGLGLKPGSDVFQVRKQRTPFHSTIPP